MIDQVRREEQITRFLVHSNEYKQALNRPSFTAYMPDGKGEKSVYRSQGLSLADVGEVGREFVEPHRGHLKGHADQSAFVILDLGLVIEPDTRPHPLHANIKGWKNSRAADRITAKKIAAAACLHLY